MVVLLSLTALFPGKSELSSSASKNEVGGVTG